MYPFPYLSLKREKKFFYIHYRNLALLEIQIQPKQNDFVEVDYLPAIFFWTPALYPIHILNMILLYQEIKILPRTF